MLLMTSLISWFIVLMQFLWKYVDELVGKGLGMWVIAQTIFYAALTLIPLSLSLGILFASLMYFGNMGERLELLAMKASGVPLYRIMRPLLLTVLLLAGALFVFQNTYMITSQVRMWTILLSARKASPELEIPEGAFYNGIKGYSIYVEKRDHDHPGRMLDIMLYDHQQGRDNVRIIRADSGRIVMDASQTFLTWRLYGGQSFENLSRPDYTLSPRPTSYAKERFGYKEILINFDANFHQADESEMRGRFVGKNLSQLNYAIDTATMRIDSMRSATAVVLTETQQRQRYSYQLPSEADTNEFAMMRRALMLGSDTLLPPTSIDSMLTRSSLRDSLLLVETALGKINTIQSETELQKTFDKDAYYEYRTNRQEWHRKFTFPAACIVFFFIGAPLGAIIRKGGLGMPVVLSVLFFLVYYIIDTFGHNMIVSEKMSVWLGMWISTLILLPVGIVLTYQATRDSASLNTEAWILFWRKLIGAPAVRKVEYKEIVMTEVDYPQALSDIQALQKQIAIYMRSASMTVASPRLWLTGADDQLLSQISERLEGLVLTLGDSRHRLIVAKLMDMPVLRRAIAPFVPSYRPWAIALMCLLPVSLPLTYALHKRRLQTRLDMQTVARILLEIEEYVKGILSPQTTETSNKLT